jgi:GR25 family glycosyltransferase involved in LPS biosynthesis
LEDDAILLDNFYNNLNSYLTALPDDIDMAFLHDGCGFHAKNIKDNQIWYREKYSRTCCSYLITKDACEKISKTIIPMSTGIDHELNKQIDIHNLNVYWCEPVIIREGSQIRFYNSSV